MEYLKQLFNYILPAIAVMLTALIFVKKFIDKKQSSKQPESDSQSTHLTLQIRLQAYERLTLFLERISPESLVMRIDGSGKNIRELHSELLKNIRAEYEHNLSQQLYVSKEAWEVVKNARSGVVSQINAIAGEMDPEAPAINLSRAILEQLLGEEKPYPTEAAIDFIKKEAGKLLRPL